MVSNVLSSGTDDNLLNERKYMENIFFDIKKIRHIGQNVIIGKTVRIRYPELVSIGDDCIIDDFTYISTSLEMNKNVHISSGAKIIGGKNSYVYNSLR